MPAQINADRLQRAQIEFLNVIRWRLQNHLKLRVLVQAIGILAVATICRSSGRLQICRPVRLWPKHAEKCFGGHGTGADLDVVRLLEHAPIIAPEGLKLEDEFLEGWWLHFWCRCQFCSGQNRKSGRGRLDPRFALSS